MSTIPIGRMNKRITLQHKTLVSDGMGAYTASWVDVATINAAIMPVSANEVIRAEQMTMTITHRIRIRFRLNIKASWRIKFGNRFFQVVSMLNPNERNEWLDIMAAEVF